MGSSEAMRNLELLSMQYSAQREWAEQAILSAMDGVEHFTKMADSFRSDCRQGMEARAIALTFERAAGIFAEVASDCARVLDDIDQELAA